jgi:hypothetical protein
MKRVCSVADPGSGAPFLALVPGSGMGKKSGSGSGFRNEQAGSYFLEIRKSGSGSEFRNEQAGSYFLEIRNPFFGLQ